VYLSEEKPGEPRLKSYGTSVPSLYNSVLELSAQLQVERAAFELSRVNLYAETRDDLRHEVRCKSDGKRRRCRPVRFSRRSTVSFGSCVALHKKCNKNSKNGQGSRHTIPLAASAVNPTLIGSKDNASGSGLETASSFARFHIWESSAPRAAGQSRS
jgi:hypothetical protein